MTKPKILRVWGKADSFDIEFTHEGGTRWKCFVPPDTKDGQYAAEIWAVNEFGELAYWTGELFMVNGVCCLQLNKDCYQVKMKLNTTEINKIVLSNEIKISQNIIQMKFNPFTQITVRKGCSHVPK